VRDSEYPGLPPKSWSSLNGNRTTGREARERPMRKRPGPERIAKILREFQADLDSGLNINQALPQGRHRHQPPYYRWKALQEDPISSEQLRVSELEAENGRLKLLVAELALDTRMLKEALKKKAMTSARRRLIADGLRVDFKVSQRRVSRALAWHGPTSVIRRSSATNGRRWPDASRSWPASIRDTVIGGSGPCWIAKAGRSSEDGPSPLARFGPEIGKPRANPGPRRPHGQDRKRLSPPAVARQG